MVETIQQNNRVLEDDIPRFQKQLSKKKDISQLTTSIQKLLNENKTLLLDIREQNQSLESSHKHHPNWRIRDSLCSQLTSKFLSLMNRYQKLNLPFEDSKLDSEFQSIQQYKNIVMIEKSLFELRELFSQMDLFLHLQENKINRIDKYVELAETYTSYASRDLFVAKTTQKQIFQVMNHHL